MGTGPTSATRTPAMKSSPGSATLSTVDGAPAGGVTTTRTAENSPSGNQSVRTSTSSTTSSSPPQPRADKQNNTVTKRAVAFGPLTDRGIKITDGLSPGEWIATAGVHYLKDGQVVRILEQ